MEPLKNLLEPDYVKEQTKDLIKIIDPLLKQEVARATHLVQDIQEYTRRESGTTPRDDVHIATTLFLHIIEVSDGIQVLLKDVCTDAAAPLLRSLFESMLSLCFIVKHLGNKDVVTAWYVNSLKCRRKYMEGHDPATPSLKKKIKKGLAKPLSVDEKKMSQVIRDEVKYLDKRINVDYKDISEKIGKGSWYMPFGGGANVEQLANHLEFKKEYTFYRMWSSRAHASETDFLKAGDRDGLPAYRAIRDMAKLQDYASVASTMLLNCIVMMREGFCPEIDLGPWYVKNIEPLHEGLKHIKVVVCEAK